MASIMDFFKPVRQDKRPREEGPSDLVLTDASVADPLPPRSPLDVHDNPSTNVAIKSTTTTEPRDAVDPPNKRQAVELSQYEQKRLTKMAANAKFLQELGMTSAQLEITRQLQQNRTPKAKPAKRRSKTESQSNLPVRRSRRLRGETVPGSQTAPRVKEEEVEADGPDPCEVDSSFVESNVRRYSVNGNGDTREAPSSSSLDHADKELVGFQVDEKSYLFDHSLRKVYDISFTSFQENGLVAAGGHGGQVSIFAFSNSYHQPEIVDGCVDDPGAHIPLMSFKAHSGWVSAISLARSIPGGANLLLTASNDASVKLWDLNHTSAILKTPKAVFTSTNLHQKGIFGMDVCGDSVLTCSKDTTVVLSRFQGDASSLEVVQHFEEHESVVKCVRFAYGNRQVFASGGNDRVVRVFDTRVAANPNVVSIGDVHSRAINSVQFHPADDNMLLSAGFDPDFYMFDLRNTSTPVCTFHQSNNNSKAIFHPIFISNGQGVVAARGHDLSLYRTNDGVTVSRGFIDDVASCIVPDPFYGRIAIAQGGKLQFADAKWKTKVMYM